MSAEADSHGLSIVLPPSHRLTQGSVFTCGVAEDYSGCRTCGLIITARCDAEQDKVHIYNYLPVVQLNDWLHRDGRGILAERLMAETLGQMKGVLKESGHALSILETETPGRFWTGFSRLEKRRRAKLGGDSNDFAACMISRSAARPAYRPRRSVLKSHLLHPI